MNIAVALAGLSVGFVVGLTGMGGGALMTPILVIFFRVQPLAAVSSDIVASLVMKPVGGFVHLRNGTVHWRLVKWLVIGSVPAAFTGVGLLRLLGDDDSLQHAVKLALGCTLVVAAAAMVVKSVLQARRAQDGGALPSALAVRPVVTLVIGVIGGLVVGLTSVGSGSLMIVMLLALYPTLSAKELVGTDLVQAVPLVAAAALGHYFFGEISWGLTGSLLVGCLPGVYLGARVSARASDRVVRPALITVLLASAMKLLGASNAVLGVCVVAAAVVGLPMWYILRVRPRVRSKRLASPQQPGVLSDLLDDSGFVGTPIIAPLD